jgi:hypothetical protein
MTFDATLRLLNEQAAVVYPGSTFRSPLRIFKDGTVQIAMLRDAGDKSGEVLYAHGDGPDSNTAVEKLLVAFVAMLDKRTDEMDKKLQETMRSLGASIALTRGVSTAIKGAAVDALT